MKISVISPCSRVWYLGLTPENEEDQRIIKHGLVPLAQPSPLANSEPGTVHVKLADYNPKDWGKK
jgi:hypothetical protein